MPAQLGQLKTGQDGKGLLRIHLWCPDDLPRLWDRIEFIIKHASLQYSYWCTTYDKMAFLLEGTVGKPSVYPETVDPAILKIL